MSLIRFLFVVFILVVSYKTKGMTPEYQVIEKKNFIGIHYVYVLNMSNHRLYCVIQSKSYFRDFRVDPYKKGRRYLKPKGDYTLHCKRNSKA